MRFLLILERDETPGGKALRLRLLLAPRDWPEKHEPLDLVGTASGKAADRSRTLGMRDDRDFRHAMMLTNEVGCSLDLPCWQLRRDRARDYVRLARPSSNNGLSCQSPGRQGPRYGTRHQPAHRAKNVHQSGERSKGPTGRSPHGCKARPSACSSDARHSAANNAGTKSALNMTGDAEVLLLLVELCGNYVHIDSVAKATQKAAC
jgi:hypothetical protein